MRAFANKAEATDRAASVEPAPLAPSRIDFRHEAKSLARLQRAIGNRAVQRLLRTDTPPINARDSKEATATAGDVGTERTAAHAGDEVYAPRSHDAVWRRVADRAPVSIRPTRTSTVSKLQRTFEDEPVSSGGNADTLVTRIQGVLREWKSECQEGVNDFVHAELASAIDGLGSGSWPNFLIALVGNTVWAAAAFVPPAAGARAVFGVSMLGIGIASVPSIPAASSEGKNLATVAELLKDYYGTVFTQLFDRVVPKVKAYVETHGQSNGNQALIRFLQDSFQPAHINTAGTPNINGNAVRSATHAYASDLLARYRQQVVPVGPATVTNVTDPTERQITTQTGLVWAESNDGKHYLAQIAIENSSIGGIQRGTTIQFRIFVDDILKDAALDRARRSQPRGIQTLPWSAIRGIPDRAPATTATQ